MKKILTALVLMSITATAAHATNRRPDIGFMITNHTKNEVVLRGNTDCADFPGTLKVPAGTSRLLVWGEGVQSGSCAFLPKGIVLTADRYNFKIDSAAPVTVPGRNGKWTFDLSGDGAITVNNQYYQSSDLIIEMSINR